MSKVSQMDGIWVRQVSWTQSNDLSMTLPITSRQSIIRCRRKKVCQLAADARLRKQVLIFPVYPQLSVYISLLMFIACLYILPADFQAPWCISHSNSLAVWISPQESFCKMPVKLPTLVGIQLDCWLNYNGKKDENYGTKFRSFTNETSF